MKHVLFTFLMLAIPAGFLCAETPFTVASAVEAALRNNVSAERSEIAYNALARKSAASWNALVPSVDAGAGVSRATATGSESYYGSVSASLTLSPAIFSSMKQTRLDYEAGRITRETALRTVEISVRKAFYGLIYERENVALLEKTVATAQKQYEQTLAKQRAGLVPEVDVLSAQVTLENLKPSLETARTTLANDLESFKQLIGVDQAEPIRLEGSLDEALSLAEIDLSGITPTSASVAALEKSLEIAKTSRLAAITGSWLPSFSLAWVYKPTAADLSASEWNNAGYVSASVSLGLDGFLPFSSAAESVRSADDSVKDVSLQLADERISAKLERESLLRSISQTRSSLRARSLSVSLAERNYELVEQAYRSGTKDILSLQDSADSLQEARLALMKESYSLISAVLDLENAIGVPFGTLGR